MMKKHIGKWLYSSYARRYIYIIKMHTKERRAITTEKVHFIARGFSILPLDGDMMLHTNANDNVIGDFFDLKRYKKIHKIDSRRLSKIAVKTIFNRKRDL